MKIRLLSLIATATFLAVGCTSPAKPPTGLLSVPESKTTSLQTSGATSPPTTAYATPSSAFGALSPGGPGSANAAGVPEWIHYTAPDHSFTVEVPSVMTQENDTPDKGITSYTTSFGKGQRSYIVATFAVASVRTRQSTPEEQAREFMKLYVGQDRQLGSMASRVSNQYAYLVTAQNAHGNNRTLVSMVVAGRGWFLEVFTPGDFPDQSNTSINRFINSFTIR